MSLYQMAIFNNACSVKGVSFILYTYFNNQDWLREATRLSGTTQA